MTATAVVPAAADAAPVVTFLQSADDDVPPGNPVIGSDRPGDIEPEDDTNYLLWALLAVCLIGAGVLLVKIERWESRRQGKD